MMNEQLKAFRSRLRGATAERANWQFWIGSPVAWLALTISSFTAFFSLIYYSDNLSVVIPDLEAASDATELSVKSPKTITFINNGNRSIAVIAIRMVVRQPEKTRDEPLACPSGPFRPDGMNLNFEQFVIKPYDSVIREVRFDDAVSQDADGSHHIRLTTPNQGKQNDAVKLSEALRGRVFDFQFVSFVQCLEFEIVAADSNVRRQSVEVFRSGSPGGSDKAYSPLWPRHLIKRNTFWTSVDGEDVMTYSMELK